MMATDRNEPPPHSLRANPPVLSKLREQLFKLWGNLEEVKATALEQRRAAAAGRQPPPDSSPPPQQRQSSPPPAAAAANTTKTKATKTTTTSGDGNGQGRDVGGKAIRSVAPGKGEEQQAQVVSNKPFACCLRQYGVKVRERDPARADAGGDGGGGYRWQRVFGLFGTRICP